ncbi:hypothetical protein HPP92_014975 [Vanilla planifolia]|uniref:Uncharacterized protein n=1 Tax=Vanilla planifolia TaxID=51239 RepID=A0A835QSK4_VANPL|nr:hypothetical protein HPP92_014975 [Vanilla planifolia]
MVQNPQTLFKKHCIPQCINQQCIISFPHFIRAKTRKLLFLLCFSSCIIIRNTNLRCSNLVEQVPMLFDYFRCWRLITEFMWVHNNEAKPSKISNLLFLSLVFFSNLICNICFFNLFQPISFFMLLFQKLVSFHSSIAILFVFFVNLCSMSTNIFLFSFFFSSFFFFFVVYSRPSSATFLRHLPPPPPPMPPSSSTVLLLGILALHLLLEAEDTSHRVLIHGNSLGWRVKAEFESNLFGQRPGVWPESESFKDTGMGAIPPRWKGICQNGSDPNFSCNRKLIGARYFKKAFEAAYGKLNSTNDNPRDWIGHGTHTLSTAAGGFVPLTNYFNVTNAGTAKGGSPAPVSQHTRSAGSSPKCMGCVWMLTSSPDSTPLLLMASMSSRKGISVIASAGNDGPQPGTVANSAPWLFTVAASTMDRDWVPYVQLESHLLEGFGLCSTTLPDVKQYPLISSIEWRLITEFMWVHNNEGSLFLARGRGRDRRA